MGNTRTARRLLSPGQTRTERPRRSERPRTSQDEPGRAARRCPGGLPPTATRGNTEPLSVSPKRLGGTTSANCAARSLRSRPTRHCGTVSQRGGESHHRKLCSQLEYLCNPKKSAAPRVSVASLLRARPPVPLPTDPICAVPSPSRGAHFVRGTFARSQVRGSFTNPRTATLSLNRGSASPPRYM